MSNYIFDFRQFKEKVTEDLESPSNWIYRGQSSLEWALKSSYLRFCEEYTLEFKLEHFFEILKDFINKTSEYFEKDLTDLSIIEKIALAQHHGIPTPFLDWTESPYIAVFFALCERLSKPSKKPFTVWALRVDDLCNQPTEVSQIDLTELSTQYSVIKTKLFQSKRLFRQLSCFTFLKMDKGFDEFLEDSDVDKSKLKRYNIAGENWPTILHELRLMGICAGTLFDTIDGIANDIISKKIYSIKSNI